MLAPRLPPSNALTKCIFKGQHKMVQMRWDKVSERLTWGDERLLEERLQAGGFDPEREGL